MRVRWIAIILCVVLSRTSARAEPPAREPDEQEAIRKGLAYAESKSLNWLHQRKCASCHHVPMMVWAQRDARLRGFKIDEKGLQEATDFLLAADNRAGLVPNPGEQERPGNPFALLGAFTTLAFREGGQGTEAAA